MEKVIFNVCKILPLIGREIVVGSFDNVDDASHFARLSKKTSGYEHRVLRVESKEVFNTKED